MKIFILTYLLLGTALLLAQASGSGKSFLMNGTDDYISVPHDNTLNPSTAITIEAWIKAEAWSPNIWENVIVSKDGWANGNEGYALRAGANGSLSFNFSSGNAWREVTAANVMVTGKWYHVAGTFDGNNSKIYLNGNEVGNLAYSGTIVTGNYDLAIGRAIYTLGGTRNFLGQIDEVKVWQSALPQTSIQEYMCKKTTSAHPQYASLVGYWKLDDTGNSITDSSPNGNNGTLNNATQQNSGAPIGDESVFTYNTSSTDISLAWNGINPDSVNLSSSSSVNSIHLYRIDAVPNNLIFPNIIDTENSHHYGLFTDASGPITVNATYYYNNSTLVVGNETYANIAGANDGSGIFNGQNWTINTTNNTFTRSFGNRSQFILGIVCPTVFFNTYTQQNLCPGDTAFLEQTGTATNLQWYNNLGPITGETNNQLFATETNDYYVVANTGICADTSVAIPVVLNPNPTVNFGNISANYCLSSISDTILNSSPSGGVFSGPGLVDSVFSVSDAGLGNHLLFYNYTDPSTGCSNSDSVLITVQPTPSVPSISANGLDICITNVENGASYQWLEDGNIINGATDTCFSAANNASYTVISSLNNCEEISAELAINYVGLDTEEQNYLNIYPNPTNNNVNVRASAEILSIEVLNSLGQLERTIAVNKKQSSVSLAGLAKGVYLFKIKTANSVSVKTVQKL